jgi:hypothetical protein
LIGSQMTTETAGVLHRLGRRSRKRFAQRSSDLRPARSCGKAARSRSSPVASSIAATANDALWGSTPIKTSIMRAYLRFGRTCVPSACTEDIPTSSPCSHTSFEPLRVPFSTAGREPRTSQPTSCGRQEVRERSLDRHPRSLAALETTKLLLGVKQVGSSPNQRLRWVSSYGKILAGERVCSVCARKHRGWRLSLFFASSRPLAWTMSDRLLDGKRPASSPRYWSMQRPPRTATPPSTRPRSPASRGWPGLISASTEKG